MAGLLAVSFAIGVFGVSRSEAGDARLLSLLLLTVPMAIFLYIRWKVRSFRDPRLGHPARGGTGPVGRPARVAG